jgi:hypothetical protein
MNKSDKKDFPQFEWKIFHKNDKGVGTAIFEATSYDFTVFRLILTDKDVLTVTSGLFKNTQLLVNNTIDLITSNKPHSFLKMERKFDEETLILIFNSEMLDTSFEIKLIEVPMNPIELLTKRVERLEQKENGSFTFAYETTSTSYVSQEQFMRWDKCLMIDENLVTHTVDGPIIKKSGTYQIIVSLVGTHNGNGNYNSILVGGKEVAKGYISDTGYQRQTHMICICKINSGEKVQVQSNFSGNVIASENANRLTLIRCSN